MLRYSRRGEQTICGSRSRFCRQGDPACGVGGGSDGDERGWNVVHYYVWGLPDYAAACLEVGAVISSCWGEDNQRVGLFLLSGCCGSSVCGEKMGEPE